MKRFNRLIPLLLVQFLLQASVCAGGEIEQSVVKIINQYNRFSWYTPWASRNTGKGTGSGFVISGKRIIIIGHLRKGPSPVPLTVDGESVDSQGWTVVRWVYDFD